MESVRQSCRPKHQVLILKCYPKFQKGVQDVKPNSSELSYLLYYASTRRSKLTKVGAFLEKRAARDVWRRKTGNVQVTLQILSALIEKVPRDLPIYARSVLTVIETVLRSDDITMVEDSLSTFETFCKHQDMAALAAEQEFANQYREVVRTYADFAAPDSSVHSKSAFSPQMAIRWKNAGLRAIRGVVSSEGLTIDGGNLLGIVLPVILQNLYNGEEDLLVYLQINTQDSETNERELNRRRRVSVATVQTVDTADGDAALASQSAADVDKKAEMEMRLLALRCLERVMVTGSNRGQIRLATRLVLKFITSKHPLRDGNYDHVLGPSASGNWATSLMEMIAKWCPVQVRFIILVTAMELLLESKPTDDLDRSFTVVFLIDWLLKSPVNMIGLSVMDVLVGLMRTILRVLQIQTSPPNSQANGINGEKTQSSHSDSEALASSPRGKLLALIEQTIGDLATHVYYGDQIADMIRAVLARIKASAPAEIAGGLTLDFNSDAFGAGLTSTISQEENGVDAFSYSPAKVTALKAIKNILVVANLRQPMATAGVESRNRVGIHTWEGTQWLLRDTERDVRYAYADAFLSWLKLETNKSDLGAKGEAGKFSKSLPKRVVSDSSADKPEKRTVTTTSSQRERATLVAQSNFLRLLHLAIYEMALECPTDESNILLLHLLLVNLVENLGVNAARFGLPMIVRLQEDMVTADSLRSFAAKANVGSLVYGYVWALTEKFDLEATKIGNEIRNEIEARKKKSAWLQKIRLPPVSLENIVPGTESQLSNGVSPRPDKFTPFRSVEELVRQIEEAYNLSTTSPANSPPSSPGRGLGIPILSVATTPDPQKAQCLPPTFTEQMLSKWSKESCLAAIEKESAKTLSINGSRSGTLGVRSHLHINGGDSPARTASPNSAVFNGTPGNATGLQNLRRMSVPESAGTPVNSSSRGSPVRVNELRRVLTVTNEANTRKLSPLRGRLDASSDSFISSSSESMVSGAFSVSDSGDRISSRPQSLNDRQARSERDGSETPRASVARLKGDEYQNDPAGPLPNGNSDVIPPVPPIPPSLSIPGGFPNDSQHSISPTDRPSTAPGPRRQSSTKGRSTARHNKTLSKHRSRSSTGLAAAAGANGSISNSGCTDASEHHRGGSLSEMEGSMDSQQRDDLRKLLNGFLSPHSSIGQNGTTPLPRAPGSQPGRRHVGGGIGRPPY